MSYLLDTHILLWWLDDNPILPESARNTIASPKNVIFVSAASIWEISIKKAMGKLAVPDDLEQAIVDSNFEPLPITIPHSMQFGILAQHHKDPFDRMLIAQATIEGLTIITCDSKFQKYHVAIL